MSVDKKENSKENTDKVSYLKGTYVWKLDKDENYKYKMKIIKSINNNIKLPISFTEIDSKEIILKPRCIVNDPFSNENSLLIWCDVIDIEGKCLNKDNRISFLNIMKLNQENLKKNIPKVSFIQKFIIKEISEETILENILEDFVRLCLASNIEIDEYSLNSNIIEFNTTMNDILGACDELLISRFIFYKLSKKHKFMYELDNQLKYMFTDSILNSDNGKEALEEYVNILKLSHSNINKDELYNHEQELTYGNGKNNLIYTPEHSYKLKNLYFVDQRFKSSSDVFDIIGSNISLVYKFNQSTDKNVNI